MGAGQNYASVYKHKTRQANTATTDTSEERERRILQVLEILMVEATPENKGQIGVFLDAFEIFVERNKRHAGQWRVGGVKGLLVDMRKKMERFWNEYMLAPTPPQDVDSPLDLINYASFAVQAIRETADGQQVGTWIWPSNGGNK